jgi:outer membrane receptor protein involved in Fe transport
MYTYNSASDDDFSGWGGKYRGEGLPHTNTGGAHYADKWGGEKYHISVNYRAAQQNVEIGGVTVTQYALPVVQTATKNQFSDGDRNAADLMFEWTADSTTSIKVTADGGRKHMKTLTGYATTAQNMEGVIQTINNRTITGNNTANYLNASCLLKKKFARKGRTFSADFRENYKENQNDGFLNSVVIHRDTNSGGADTTVAAQRKSATSDAQLFSGKLVYTEPISKKSFLEINYMLTVNNSLSSNYSYNSPGGYNEAVDSLYSSNYQYNITTNKGGLNYKVITEKISLAAGASFSNAHYTQTDKLWQTNSLVRDYPNVFPSATLTYKFKKQTSLYVSYQGNTRQPTINEIQPLRQNIDPLNQTIGNPDLKQEFANRVSLRYNDYKMLSGRSTWLSFTFRQVNDAISTRQIVSPAGNTVQYINVSGNYSLSMYASKGYKIKKPDVNLNGYVNSSISRLNNIINDTANTSVNSNYSVGLRTSYTKRDKLELSVDPSVSWNGNKYSVSRFSNDYWTVAVDLSGSVTLPANVEINTSINVSVRQRTELYPRNNNVVRWNAWVSKKLLSNKQLELRASVFDILNQNIGYSREAVNGMVTENRYTTIMRYGMLNVIWNFSHTPGGAAPAAK